MIMLKCKICGGDIPALEAAAHGICELCGNTSTLPKANDEKLVNLFNRANHYRRQNDFDKGLAAYKNILNEDSGNAEAYWGITLCRYGIEYVEDPVSKERMPACRRLQYKSILTDADYLLALDSAPDSYVKGLYEQEAQKISEIQKGMLAISNKEEPFDVFICCKESAEDGDRTLDSTLAQDIYYQLTDNGYKVFFAKITLEDKRGDDEPYIFAALNSSKVMLVIGTKREYFEAMWVKNEWSRYLALMQNGRSRHLIPCYRDMDPYDIPEELSYFQFWDMSKMEFMRDLIQRVKKAWDADEAQERTSLSAAGQNTEEAPQPYAQIAPGIESLIKRGRLFLEDNDWNQADKYFDKVLDIDPEYAPAYIGKLCAALKITQESLLEKQEKSFNDNADYKKALRFADDDYRVILEGYAYAVKERLEEAVKCKKAEEEEAVLKTLEQLRLLASKVKSGSKKTSGFIEKREAEMQKRREEAEIQKQREEAELKKKNEEQERKYEEAMKNWESEVARKYEQSDIWKAQGWCPHCGSEMGIFLSQECKACRLPSGAPVKLPEQPLKPVPVKIDVTAYAFDDNMAGIANETVQFGGNTWRVLDIQDGKALILSNNIIGKNVYNTEEVEVTWERCTLRKYLNGEFYNKLSEAEKSIIATVKLENKDNQWYGINGGNATIDKIFLLSVEEVVKYFFDSGQLKNRPNGNSYRIDDQFNDNRKACDASGAASWWWLRSPGYTGHYAANVLEVGRILMGGFNVAFDYGGIRPALWLNLEFPDGVAVR